MNILHLDASTSGARSASRQLGAMLVQAWRDGTERPTVAYRDLAADPPAHLDGALLQALRPAAGATSAPSPAVQRELALTERAIAELLACDVLVIGAPMVNYSVPTQLKAWIDRVAQAGRTFRYTSAGPEGLVRGKQVVIVSTRGGLYAGTPGEVALDHQEAYLRAVLGFMGMREVSVLRAEGLNVGPAAKERAMAAAQEQLGDIARSVAAAARRAAHP